MEPKGGGAGAADDPDDPMEPHAADAARLAFEALPDPDPDEPSAVAMRLRRERLEAKAGPPRTDWLDAAIPQLKLAALYRDSMQRLWLATRSRRSGSATRAGSSAWVTTRARVASRRPL